MSTTVMAKSSVTSANESPNLCGRIDLNFFNVYRILMCSASICCRTNDMLLLPVGELILLTKYKYNISTCSTSTCPSFVSFSVSRQRIILQLGEDF